MQWFSVVKSVLASFFGVQTQAQYVKDANMPSFIPFLLVGIVMIVLFVVSLWLLVQFLLT